MRLARAARRLRVDCSRSRSARRLLERVRTIDWRFVQASFAEATRRASTNNSAAFRWLRNPAALLYDPALENAVLTLMRKLCLMLVSEINRLGGAVIHCSFNKLVLSTQRKDLASAQAFITTLCASLRKQRAFRTLSLESNFFTSSMLWLDPSNKAFIKCFDCSTGAEMLNASCEFALSSSHEWRLEQAGARGDAAVRRASNSPRVSKRLQQAICALLSRSTLGNCPHRGER